MGKPCKNKEADPRGHTTRSSSAPPPLITEYFGQGATAGQHEAKMAPAPCTAAVPSPSLQASIDRRNNRYGSEGDLPTTHSLIPPADLSIAPPAPSGGHILGSLSQTFPPCLIGPAFSVSSDQPSPSWDSYAPDWDPRSLPQRSQPHRDRAPSLSPLQRDTVQAPAPPRPHGHQDSRGLILTRGVRRAQ